MGKSTHFSGQPIYGQVIKMPDKSKNLSNKLRKWWRTLHKTLQRMGLCGGDAVCCNHEVRLVEENYRSLQAEALKPQPSRPDIQNRS